MLERIFKIKSDIPLEQVKATRLIPWLIGIMIYLATMALASAVLIHRFTGSWLDPLQSTPFLDNYLKIFQVFLGFSFMVTGVVAFVAVVTIIFVTRMGLTIHEKIIHILRLMGADKKFISRQFQVFFFKLALKGGVSGLILSILTYGIICINGHFLKDIGMLQEKGLWFVVLSTPLFMVSIILVSARMTVFMTLEEE